MCTLKANNHAHNSESRIPKTGEVVNKSIRALSKCRKCKTEQFVHRLTCQNCGTYLNRDVQPSAVPGQISGLKVMAFTGLTVTAICVGAMFMLHVI